MTDTRRSRVPPQIRAPYASRLSGKWKGHRTAGGAWRQVWSNRGRAGTLVVRVDPDTGLGEPLEPPEKQPGGASGGAPGERVSPRRVLTASPEQFDRWDRQAAREGHSWAEWAREIMDDRCDKAESGADPMSGQALKKKIQKSTVTPFTARPDRRIYRT